MDDHKGLIRKFKDIFLTENVCFTAIIIAYIAWRVCVYIARF
jgi:hypothetical protein